jgi:predicted Zn-dependent protease
VNIAAGDQRGRGITNMHGLIRSRTAALLLAAALSGCAAQNLNPVTGKAIYAPVPAATEAYYGQKASDKMAADYGLYQDAALTAYVARIGQALAKNVVRKEIKYSFAILNEDDINAYALPGGYIYITRGALNYANSEAEIAGILGHEIGHVDAFHFLHRKKRDTVKMLLSVLLRRTSKAADDLALADELAISATDQSNYSQDQELEADALGIHYMALAGYDPQGLVAAIRTDEATSTFDDGGMKGNAFVHDLYALDRSHPATRARRARAEAAVQAENAKLAALAPGIGIAPKVERDAFLAAIDGMAFGEDPADGAVDGRRMVNADLGFSFEAPEEFDLWTNHGGGFGFGPKAAMTFETAGKYTGQSLTAYVQSEMMEKMTVSEVRALDIPGYRGATGIVATGPFKLRVAALHDRGTHLYELVYVAHENAFDALDAGFVKSLKSFHPPAGPDATPRPARHIRIVTVKPGDTPQNLAARMAVPDQKLAWFRVVNGLEPGDEVKPGDKVKLVE